MGDFVGLVGPLGISVVISYVSTLRDPGSVQPEYPTMSEFLNNGYVMGVIVLVAALAQGTFSQSSTHLVNVEGIHLKGALQVFPVVYAYPMGGYYTSWVISCHDMKRTLVLKFIEVLFCISVGDRLRILSCI
jgi:hypothetical protein